MRRRQFITFFGAAAAVWKHAKRPTTLLREAGYLLLGVVSLATVTGLYFWLDAPLVAAAFTYLVVLVLLSLVSNLASLIVLSFIGVGCLNYFFAPPIFSFRVDYPQDLVTISAFVITSFVVNFLVTRVRGEQRDHMMTYETLRDANQRLEVTNQALRVENAERKQAEQALMRSEAYLAETQKLTHTGSWAWDASSQQVLYCSEEMFRIFGLDPRERFASLVNERVDNFDEYRVVLPDGTVKHINSSGHPVLDGNGELIELVGTATDVTDRKRAEEALQESEYKLRQITETVPGLVWSNGPDGEPTHISQRMLDYSGMPFEEFGHRGWEAFVHPADYPETAGAFWHAIQTGTSYQGVMRLRRADGEFRWHHARCEPLLTSMKGKRPKTNCVAAKPIWRKHRG
jgi:PAS domain S-box-containing protein